MTEMDSLRELADGRLAGRVAVVTGAASGIGRAIALQLARAGAEVLVHTRQNRQGAEEVRDTIRAGGSRAELMLADFSQPAERERFVREAFQWSAGVDIWVNNAGADVLTGSVAERSFDEKLELLWRVDVQGTIALSREVGRRMVASLPAGRDRSIINMGWDQAQWGMEGDSGEMFAAAKGAVMAFSLSLAKSLAPQVRVNCLAPGWIQTKWGRQADDYWQRRAAGESLLQRWGTAEDVAAVACFLASPAAGFITGQTWAINGGRPARGSGCQPVR